MNLINGIQLKGYLNELLIIFFIVIIMTKDTWTTRNTHDNV